MLVLSMLTYRKNEYIKYRILGLNPVDSARKAQYSPKNINKTSSRLEKDVDISTAIASGLAEIAKKLEITPESLHIYWKNIMYPKDGEEQGSLSDRLRASEDLAKALGLFKEQSVNIAVFQNLDKTKIAALKGALAENRIPTPQEIKIKNVDQEDSTPSGG